MSARPLIDHSFNSSVALYLFLQIDAIRNNNHSRYICIDNNLNGALT
jgi:hypothetical protein